MEPSTPSTSPTLDRGTGPALVFLHGYPLSHAMWTRQAEDLAAGHQVVLLDLPGYGLARDWPVPETLSGFAESVHRTLAQRFSTPVVVVGHSFGGYVALQLYREHPELFRALVLTNTRSEADGPEAKEKRLATVSRLEDPSQHLDVEEVTRGLVAPGTWELGGALVEAVRSMVREAPSATLRGSLKAMANRPDSTPVLSTIRVPTLVVWGEEDRLIPPQQTQQMVARIRGSSGAGIAGSGHLPSLERPQEFNRVLREFLPRTSAAGAPPQ